MSDDKRILIAGGGPVGLFCGLLLGRAGLPVRIFDANPCLQDDPRAATTHPATLDMLSRVPGLVEDMARVGLVTPIFQFWDRPSNTMVAEFDHALLKDDTAHPFVIQCEQFKTANLLLERIEKLDNVEILFNHTVREVEQDETSVAVEADTPNGVVRHTGAYLIGADGGRSTVRKQSGIAFEGFTYEERFLVLTTPFDFAANRGYCERTYIADPEEWCNCFKVSASGPPGLWRTVFPADATEAEEKTLSDADVHRRMQKFFPLDRRHDIVHRNLYSIHQRVAATFTQGPGAACRRQRACQQFDWRHGTQRGASGCRQRQREAGRGAAERRPAEVAGSLLAAAAYGHHRVRPGADNSQQEAAGGARSGSPGPQFRRVACQRSRSGKGASILTRHIDDLDAETCRFDHAGGIAMSGTATNKARPFLAASAAFKAGTDTPRAFLDRCLETIDAREKDVQAFVCLDREGAVKQADAATARWRAGNPLSPIDGMPIGVKDVIETADMPTQMGSAIYQGWKGGRESASVYALKEAGAVIVGKTVTTEFAATEPGPTRNPWDLTRTPGGSSSGSCAGAAAGFFSVALGTQVVGSILRPSSYCGVIGFKPTVGAINRGGTHDTMSQSAQGAIGSTLADVWAVMRAIADRCGGDPGHPGLYGPDQMPAAQKPAALVLLETPGWANASDAAKAALEGAVQRLKDAGVAIRTRKDDPAAEAVEKALERAMLLTRKINAWESRWPLNTYRDIYGGKLSKLLTDRAAEAEAMTLEEYRGFVAEREQVRQTFARLSASGAAAITLSADGEAPVGLRSTGNATFVVPGSLLGVPAVSLPVLAAAGLPLGLQVLGFQHKDAELMATSAAIEEIVGNASAVRA